MRILRRIAGAIILLSIAAFCIMPDFIEDVAENGLEATLVIYTIGAVATLFLVALLALGAWLLFGD
ncbi:MAG: hypothetical protein HDR03_09425 [Lachnospiraceae bacterium]|nr:hypothetical protein [Lachnospiraceae bacterium]